MRYTGIAGLTLALVLVAPSVAAESVNLDAELDADRGSLAVSITPRRRAGTTKRPAYDRHDRDRSRARASLAESRLRRLAVRRRRLATALVARSKGADVVALMSIYANTGQTFYWLKSYGVNGPKGVFRHKIGNPPGDASRRDWPAFAKAGHRRRQRVTFVNVGPTRQDRGT